MNKVTLREFLLHHTQCYELCVIRDRGWIVFTVWIDDEDLFRIPQGYGNKPVIEDHWGMLTVTREDGTKERITCHYIDI